MKIINVKNYEELSLEGARIIAEQIKTKPASVLGLATGSTPIGLYKALAEMKLDFTQVITYNLDEYYPIKKDHDQSYNYFMNDMLFKHINIKKENTNLLSGEVKDYEKECADYEKRIENAGGVDLQLLGIGVNGHIGFIEPGDYLPTRTFLTTLTESTIEANKRFFETKDDVPKQALTMGISTIMAARRILLLISGESKRKAFEGLLAGKVTTNNPSTMLLMHPDVTVITDLV